MNLIQAGFDYSIVDAPMADALRHHADAIRQHTVKAAEHVWLMGKEYAEAQAKLANHGNGTFQTWVEAETPHSWNTAHNCIRVYRRFDRTKFVRTSIATSALYELARPSTPEPARIEAIERAERGEPITYTESKEIIARHNGIEQEPEKPSYEARAESYSEQASGYDWEDEPKTEPASDYDSNEWYTPREFIQAARAVMGSIDLDPASCDEAQEFIQAHEYFTKDTDGLAQDWRGKIWLNPPYGEPLPWVEKLTTSFDRGMVVSALLLVNTANSPQWSRLLWESQHTVCLLARRVRFWRPDRPDAKGTAQDQMIWYLGSDAHRFKDIFSEYGAIR